MNYVVKEFWQKNFHIQVFASGRSRTAEPWVAGSSSYPLDHEVLVERIILDLPDKLRSREILTENILLMNRDRKYSKSKSLNLNSEAKNIFNR